MKENSENPEIEKEEETPEWLKVIQLNSWEAELLISALFLYILFQIPDVIEMYRGVHFERADMTYRLLGFFKDALVVLSIGYVIHIVTRGIWVANIGLSYVFPQGMDIEKLRLKGKFKEELQSRRSLDSAVLTLEKIASMTYAVSFISSALMLSLGMIVFTILIYVEWILAPAMQSGNGVIYMVAFVGLTLYALLLLIIFIDFITNGFFRRDSWAAKPYYYVALVFRVITFSFIYKRMLLTIVSSLPRWKAHLIPVLFVIFLIGYMQVKTLLGDNQLSKYYERSFVDMRNENYESMRYETSILIATIQDDIIDENVLRLFVRRLEEFNELYNRDPDRVTQWVQLGLPEKLEKVNDYLTVKIDSTKMNISEWKNYKHATTFKPGFLTFIDLNEIQFGDHKLHILLDTANMNEKQKEYLDELDAPRVLQASIPFYKSR